MHKQHEREDFVHTEGPSYKSHFIVHDEDYERYVLQRRAIKYVITNKYIKGAPENNLLPIQYLL